MHPTHDKQSANDPNLNFLVTHTMALLPTAASSSLKVLFVSTAVVSMTVALNHSAPAVTRFLCHNVPFIYESFLSYFTPAYLYLVINCIIISIVATSRLQQKLSIENREDVSAPMSATVSGYLRMDFPVYVPGDAGESDFPENASLGHKVENSVGDPVNIPGVQEESRLGDSANVPANLIADTIKKDAEIVDAGKMAFQRPMQRVGSLENCIMNEKESSVLNQKGGKAIGSASARFGQRRSFKSSRDGKTALRVTKARRQETMESTWKAMTDGRSMPLSRYLKKSDTWDSCVRPAKEESGKDMKKSETFSERTRTEAARNTSTKLKKEPSLSQEELNRRVEAFIKKFNDEMRLQRQESLARYLETMKRGPEEQCHSTSGI